MKRKATAVWNGPGKTGKGNLTTQSGVLNTAQYSFGSRFEEGIGTNPEELIAAAHAGCFSMKLSFVLGAAGFEPTSIETECGITLENGAITNSHLKVAAVVPGIGADAFTKCVEEAATTCPISKSLNTNITHESTLKA
jgi:osmotically inducible protein OsmC